MKLEELFKCPLCKGGLKRKEGMFRCLSCLKVYPIVEGVPVFMTGSVTDKYSDYWNSGWSFRYKKGDHEFHQIPDEEYKNIVRHNVDKAGKLKTVISSARPEKDSIVLNIGCGLDEASSFAFMGVNNYIGIDYSFFAAKFSLSGIQKLKGKGIVAQANAEILPIESNVIDLVYSSGVLHHTPNTKQALTEVVRVLKPGGRGVIGLYSTFSPTFIVAKIVGVIKSVFQFNGKKWYEFTETAWQTEDTLNNPWTRTYSKNDIKKIFSNFDDVCNLNIRSTGFLWGNIIPFFGKYLTNTKIGKLTEAYFSNKFGSMLVITFEKQMY
jgi:ubiquinone/menaquinone biosynthesis C-methylase UbiE/uncharacterized protein YbaR (Trm112 family)